MSQWWYNTRTGQAEEGPQSPVSERNGPFGSREEAERAPQIAAERARAWAEEDERNERDDD
jgi:hypothetical protein